jgi:hydroxypyruvate isomerase
MQGNLTATIQENLARTGHIQLTDNPGGHEPDSGEINIPFPFGHPDRIAYGGWVDPWR